MIRIALLLSAAGSLAFAFPAAAQTHPNATVAAPQAASPSFRTAPVAPLRVFPHPVSPYGSNQPFPPPRFYSEVVTHVFTRQAMYIHTREVDLANAASALIDRGDCVGAQNYLLTMGAAEMAARVPQTCEARRRGLL